MRINRFIVFVLCLLFLGGLVTCTIDGSIAGGVTITNYVGSNVVITNQFTVIDYSKYTNIVIITNQVVVTNSEGYIVQGNIYITNRNNQGLVQPTFDICGYIEGDLTNFVTSIELRVTNDGYVTNSRIYMSGGSTLWEGTLFQESNVIHVQAIADLGDAGHYTMGINFVVTNIPACSYDHTATSWVTNVVTANFSGFTYVTAPDDISKVYLLRVNEAGATNALDCTLDLSANGWTNTINACAWNQDHNLDIGANTFFGYVISTADITNYMDTFVVTRALIGVDGVKDATWSSAPVMGSSPNPGYNGYRLGELRISNDEANIYFWVDAANVPDSGSTGNGARISIAIDTNTSAGCTNEAWGGTFVYAPTNNLLPDLQLEFRIQEGGGQAMYVSIADTNGYIWSNYANNWNDNMRGIQMAVDRTVGFEIAVPKSVFAMSGGDSFRAIVVLSGFDGEPGNSQAWDVIPEDALNPNVTNENQFDTTLGVYSSLYIIQ